MSMDPGMMQQMLMQRLQQPAQGGMQGSNPAAQLAQKAMLVRSLQGGTPLQQHQANAMVPGTNAQIAADPAMQALQQAGMQPMQMGQPPIPPPNGMPTPGFS